MKQSFYWVTKGYDLNKCGYVYKVSLSREMAYEVLLEWATLDPDMVDISHFVVPSACVYLDEYGYLTFAEATYNAILLTDL